MNRSLVFSVALFAGCLFVGTVLKAQAAAYSLDRGAGRPVATMVQADDGCGESGEDWALFAAASSAQ
jgi:hypothetical protein